MRGTPFCPKAAPGLQSLYEFLCILGDHQLLIGRNDEYANLGAFSCDLDFLASAVVLLLVDGDTHEGEVVHDLLSELDVVLTDTRGEYDRVNVAELCDISADETLNRSEQHFSCDVSLVVAFCLSNAHVSDISGDVRDVCIAEAEGNHKAHIAREMLLRSVKRFIGAYIAELGHVDAIVFTAGIGENDIELREKVMDNFAFMGITIDKEKNDCRGKEVEITGEGSKVRVFIIPTNEELMIAKDTEELVKAL